jgi:RNA polymerase sigma-70 factor (ECF subfamily)
MDELLRRLRAGDRGAFDDVVRRHHGQLFALAMRLLGNVADAQEVTQEAFLAGFEAIGGFEGRSKLSTWLLAITYRKAMGRLKRDREDRWQSSVDLDDPGTWAGQRSVGGITDAPDNPEQAFAKAELRRLLESVLDTLPGDSRALLELCDLQGVSSADAAEILGIKEGTVRVRLHRTRRYLMEEMRRRMQREKTP